MDLDEEKISSSIHQVRFIVRILRVLSGRNQYMRLLHDQTRILVLSRYRLSEFGEVPFLRLGMGQTLFFSKYFFKVWGYFL